LTYYGIASNLVSYLINELHEGSAEAVTNVWIWGGVAWLLPLLGGFVADAFLGRYWTITCSLLVYVMVSFTGNCTSCESCISSKVLTFGSSCLSYRCHVLLFLRSFSVT
jgi:dipeptide/tripeptide permease